MHKISVIVPVYKVEKYLHRCIDSIINQTYKNLEIILVDDGSPDDCPKICDEYAIRDERIKVIHIENGGVSKARNRGIREATGDYIAFVDSDDWIEPDTYEVLYNKLREEDSDLARGFYTIDENNDPIECSIKKEFIDKEIKEEFLYNVTFAYDVIADSNYQLQVSFWTYLIKSDLIKHNNIFFDEKMKIGEDYVFISQILTNAKKLVILDKVIYHYRIRGTSVMNSYKPTYVQDMQKKIEFIEKLYCEDRYSEIIKRKKKVEYMYSIINCCNAIGKDRKKRYNELGKIRNSMKIDNLLGLKFDLKNKKFNILLLCIKFKLLNLILVIGDTFFMLKENLYEKDKCNSTCI